MRLAVDAVSVAQPPHEGALFVLVDFVQRMVHQRREGLMLLATGPAGQGPRRARRIERDLAARLDDLLQKLPPQIGVAVGQPRTDIDREGNAMRMEDRRRMDEIVAIAVIEGDRQEAFVDMAALQPVGGLVEADEAGSVGLQLRQQAVEELRFDMQQSVEAGAALARAHMMQHQDRADTAQGGAEQRRQPAVTDAVHEALAH